MAWSRWRSAAWASPRLARNSAAPERSSAASARASARSRVCDGLLRRAAAHVDRAQGALGVAQAGGVVELLGPLSGLLEGRDGAVVARVDLGHEIADRDERVDGAGAMTAGLAQAQGLLVHGQ